MAGGARSSLFMLGALGNHITSHVRDEHFRQSGNANVDASGDKKRLAIPSVFPVDFPNHSAMRIGTGKEEEGGCVAVLADLGGRRDGD